MRRFHLLPTGAIALGLLCGCLSRGVLVSAEKRQLAEQWRRYEPTVDWGAALEASRWRVVLDANEPVAETMLKTVPFTSLTEQQANQLAGIFPSSLAKSAKPFLVRCVGSHVGTAGFEVSVRKNVDVIAVGVALSHFDIPAEPRPLVVWLDRPPHELYTWFSVAE